MVLNRLSCDFFKLYLPEQAVLLRVLRTGVEQCPLYMRFDLTEFRCELPAGVPAQLPTNEPGGGDGGFDLMHPAFHIFPVLPLGGKLAEIGLPDAIKTRRGMGYQL